tara:strand:- start:193 stop:1086 length:894 start_codon:yes stop_codon:yes gene_type:complete
MISRFSFIFFILLFLSISFFNPELLKSIKSLIPFLLGIVMLGMGLTIKLNDLREVISEPKWISIAVILQFIVMPITAFVLTIIFGLASEIALGVIILGCCPGGTASNVITYLCKGNVALSVMSTLTSTLVSIILTPLLISILANVNIEIDIFKLIKSVFLIVFFPVTTGLVLNFFFKKLENLNKFLPKFSEFIIALIIGIIISLNLENIKNVQNNLIFCILLHNLIGLTVGYFCSSFLSLPQNVKKTIAIEVGMQNSGLGMALSLIHFTKLVALPSAIFSLWHNISAVGLVYFWKKK